MHLPMQTHGRLHYAPGNLKELQKLCSKLEYEFLNQLIEALNAIRDRDNELLNCPLLILLVIPVSREAGELHSTYVSPIMK